MSFPFGALPFPKINWDGVSSEVDDPAQWCRAVDWNAVCQALTDTETFMTGSAMAISAVSYGLPTDGTTDAATAIQAALDAAGATVNGGVGGWVDLPKGTYIVGTQLTIPDGVGLRGAGPDATIIKAKSTFNAASLIRNLHQDGTQEFAFLESLQIQGNKGGGAVCSTAVVDFVSLFVNSYIRDVLVRDGSAVGLRVAATNAMGPVLLENVWVVSCDGHNYLIEEAAGNVGAPTSICGINLTSEHQGSNKSAFYLKGVGNATQWNFFNTHIEMGSTPASGRTGITIDGVSDVLFDGIQLLCTLSTVSAGVTITNVAQSARIVLRGINNANLINPVINDLKNSITIGAVPVPVYMTPDAVIYGANLQAAASGTAGRAAVFKNSAGTARAWFDGDGTLTGSSVTSAGLDVATNTADGSTARVLAMLNSARTRSFGFYYPDGTYIRFKCISGGFDAWDVDNSGNMRSWNLHTFLASIKGDAVAASAPSSGTHAVGEIQWVKDAASGGFAGWYCTVAGTPGTWVAFAAIGATVAPSPLTHAGDGRDGTISPTNGSTTTLTKNMQWSTFTVPAGTCTVSCKGFVPRIQKLDLSSGGTVVFHHDGAAASGATGATGMTSEGTLKVYSGSGANGIGNAGQTGSAPGGGCWLTSDSSGTGGVGQAGGGGAGGAGGPAPTVKADTEGSVDDFEHWSVGQSDFSSSTRMAGGSGGGSAAGSGSPNFFAGGGGGAGGGNCVVIIGQLITPANAANVTVRANGGNGGTGPSSGTVGGGGGGGRAGVALMSGDSTTLNAIVVQANCGSGGTPAAAGRTVRFGGS